MPHYTAGALRPPWYDALHVDTSFSPGERDGGERRLAVVRLCLAAALYITVFVDPAFAAPQRLPVHLLLGGYIVFAAAVLVVLHVKVPWPPRATLGVHVADVGAAAAVLQAEGGWGVPSMLAVFVLVAAAHRWTLRVVLATAALIVLPSALLATAADLPQGFGRALLLPAILVLCGVPLAYVALAEKRLRTQAAALAEAVSHIELRSGLRQTMGVALATMLRLLGATRAVVAIQEHSTGRAALWESGGDAGTIRVSPLERQALSQFSVGDDARAWLAARHGRSVDALELLTVDAAGRRRYGRQVALPEPLVAATGPFRRLIGIALDISGEYTGVLIVVDPAIPYDRESAVALAQRLVRYITPAVLNVCLLSRLRSRSALNERARVARELHDGIMQGVLGVQVQLHALSGPAAAYAPGLSRELVRLGGILRDETLTLRDLLQRLNPVDPPPGQIVATLGGVVRRFEREAGVAAQFVAAQAPLDLPPRACREVVRMVQEALVNVRKHSGARSVVVRLDTVGGICHLSVEDDGRGFPFNGRIAAADAHHGAGLPSVLQQRARLLGGALVVVSNPGRGARVEITFPVSADATSH